MTGVQTCALPIFQGLHAPSWVNSQPYHAHIVTGETLQRIKDDYLEASRNGKESKPELPPTPLEDWSPLAQQNMTHWREGVEHTLGDMKAMEEAASHLYNAPAIVYLTLPKNFSPWSLYDLGGFGMGMIIAATDQGIASLPAYRFVIYPDIIRQHVEIPVHRGVGITVAQANPKHQHLVFRNLKDRKSVV